MSQEQQPTTPAHSHQRHQLNAPLLVAGLTKDKSQIEQTHATYKYPAINRPQPTRRMKEESPRRKLPATTLHCKWTIHHTSPQKVSPTDLTHHINATCAKKGKPSSMPRSPRGKMRRVPPHYNKYPAQSMRYLLQKPTRRPPSPLT